MTHFAPKATDRLALGASLPFFLTHLAVIPLVWLTGFAWEWALLALGSYYLRMFGITAGFHRYFAHRAFQTSRAVQFLLAFLATTSVQKGVLWWAAHHRHHHRHSDQEDDVHSPYQRGLWWAHVGWFLCTTYDATRFEAIRDFARFPELRFLNRFPLLPPVLGGVALYLLGGLPWLTWGGVVPTVLLWHGTFTINSLMHMWGKRRYLTTDTSRNSLLLALLTCGEGWHNNHHFHQNTANQGWFWWEVDLTYYVLRALSWVGLVWGLRTPEAATKAAHLKYSPAQQAQLVRQSRPWLRVRPPLDVRPADEEPSLGLGAPAAALERR